MSAEDLIFGNAVPTMGFEVGTEIRGRVTGKTKVHQKELIVSKGEFKQGKPLYWNDGEKTTEKLADSRPVEDPVLTAQTGFTAWEGVAEKNRKGDDDGVRRVFVTSRGKRTPGSVMDAMRAAFVEAGVNGRIGIEIGSHFSLKCIAEGKPANKAARPPKIFEAVWYRPGNDPEWIGEIPVPAAEAEGTESDDVWS